MVFQNDKNRRNNQGSRYLVFLDVQGEILWVKARHDVHGVTKEEGEMDKHHSTKDMIEG
jgi:hypothetical protein